MSTPHEYDEAHVPAYPSTGVSLKKYDALMDAARAVIEAGTHNDHSFCDCRKCKAWDALNRIAKGTMNDEEMVNRLRRTRDASPPSAEALSLAVKLSCHTHCQLASQGKFDDWGGYPVTPCDGCLGDARTIDEHLQLPQRNAALLLAQGAVETYQSASYYVEGNIMEQLREALGRIGKP